MLAKGRLHYLGLPALPSPMRFELVLTTYWHQPFWVDSVLLGFHMM